MQEEYLMERLVKGKTDKEKEQELLYEIMETKEKLKLSIINFEYAEDDLIDYFAYQIKAHQAKLDYLIKLAKRKDILVDRIRELEIRMYNKNNIA